MSEPLRVAVVTNYPRDPSRIAGGVQAVSVRLVAELCQRPGLEVHVVHCHSDISASQIVSQGRLTVHYIAQTRQRVVPNMITGVQQIAERLRAIAPDVVHVHGPSLAVAALRAGYQPIWTIHSVLRHEAANYRGVFHWLRFALARYFESRALAAVSHITAVSPYVVEMYRTRTHSQMQVIENPAPPDYFDLAHRPVPGRILVPAAIIPLKDPLTVVRAVAGIRQQSPDLSLHLAGSLASAVYVAEVRAEIARLGLGATVSLLGPQDVEQMRRAYSTATVVALPSRQEVCPMAIIEAMSAAVPIVASAVGGIPYLVDEGVTGRILPIGAPDAWAGALADLVHQPDAARKMGQAARKAACSRFDVRWITEQYLSLYRLVAR